MAKLASPPQQKTYYQTSQILDSVKTSQLPKGLKIAKTQADMARVINFRRKIFSVGYPDLKNYRNDPHDAFSIIMYAENAHGDITSTARLIFDNPLGFPADDYAHAALNKHRHKGLKIVEAGRLAISEEGKKNHEIALYYEAFYTIPVENKIDFVVVVINENHVKFYCNRLGAKVLATNIENMNGSGLTFACVEWCLEKTSDRFFKWIGLDNYQQKVAPYAISTWNKYSQMFASIYTDYQRKVYQETCKYLQGSVVDLGCGPARLAPLLIDNKEISEYTGIEYSQDMFEIAQFTMKRLARPSFKVLHQKAEDAKGTYTSAVSLLSYYAFSDPRNTLKHIYSILEPNGIFVVANPNENLDQLKLQKEVEKEMMWHPDYALFRKYNLEIADNSNAEFSSMNQLLMQLQSIGFEIITCHQRYYEGGLNFIVCRKPL